VFLSIKKVQEVGHKAVIHKIQEKQLELPPVKLQ